MENKSHKNCRFTDAQVMMMRGRYRRGETVKSIAMDSGVHYLTVCRLLSGRTYSHLPKPVVLDRGRFARLSKETRQKIREEWLTGQAAIDGIKKECGRQALAEKNGISLKTFDNAVCTGYCSTLSSEQLKTMLDAHSKGRELIRKIQSDYSQSALAEEHGVTPQYIHYIVRDSRYKKMQSLDK